MMGKPPEASHLGSFRLPATPGDGAEEVGGRIGLVHLPFGFFKLLLDEPFHLFIIIIVELLGVNLPL